MDSQNCGKSWWGRASVTEKFRVGRTTLQLLDAILEAVGLVSIEHVPSGRGKDKIVYVVHDPLTVEEFDSGIGRIKERLKTLVTEDEAVIKLLGKQRADEFRL